MKVSEASLPQRLWGENTYPPSSSFSGDGGARAPREGGCPLSSACGCITLISASLITWPLFFCVKLLLPPSYKDPCDCI